MIYNFNQFLVLLFFPLSLFSQNGYEEIIKPRKNFTYDKVNKFDTEKIILQNDTLYNNQLSLPHLDYLKKISSFANEKNSLIDYIYVAFGNRENYIVKQWSCPIIVFMDHSIPKDVRAKFEAFYSAPKFKEVENLSISFTDNLENANYYIKTVQKEINGYSKDFEFPSEELRKINFLTGTSYKMQIDKNAKFYSTVMSVNLESANYQNGLLRKLKQTFYKSLGNFASYNYNDPTSITQNKGYDNSNEISEADLNILKIHYATLYEHKVNLSKFRALAYLAITTYE